MLSSAAKSITGKDHALRLVERIRAVFDRSLFDRIYEAGNSSSIPVFVVGMPRSGSTLVEQILATHPQIMLPVSC